ncbi:glycerol-3-phosphate dehydrogenase/oxidase [Hoeflea sp. G2-23]|uniref:Glycerol-3-phosphate dehydrogenase/oxidase n=1 Tax=Hoeflea algicola TaxID=2983763 RepID=A0ABT3Z486_9HYPH|nr:glycerol-3-phosphate dehydrogenase/oxidase [Hoeflea algicola]MCY0146575.1 glycerol-3-phosphate dehydrogenase/oxidase [Hoeflea algicola]
MDRSPSQLQDPTPPPEAVDVLIIGGGINGISTFRELALQGVNVVLMERDDFCSGASAALSRMVHGGLRYLENGEFRLVRQSLEERDRLLNNAPHCVSPLPTVVPIMTWFRGTLATTAAFFNLAGKPRHRPGLMIRLGLTLYDVMSWRSRSMPRHKGLSRAAIRKLVPGITDKAVGGVLYFDARVTNPERLGVEMVIETEAATDARAFSYTEIVSGDRTGLVWRDRLSGAEGRIVPKVVVNATGAWVDKVSTRIDRGNDQKRVEGTKGSHLMINNEALKAALGDRMVYYENADGRICITFAHAGSVMVGSTDIRVEDPDSAVCFEDEKAYMLSALANVFPSIVVKDEEIVHVFTGVRPLPVSAEGFTGRISRDHSIDVEAPGARDYAVLTLIGGKWTTFRIFGEEVADLALSRLGIPRKVDTRNLRIGGGRDFPTESPAREHWLREIAARTALPLECVRTLAGRYGSRAADVAAYCAAEADGPLLTASDYSRREMLFLVRNERVRELGDILLRRTTLGIEGRITADLLAEVSELLAAPLGWTESQRQAAIDRFNQTFARRHRMQQSKA